MFYKAISSALYPCFCLSRRSVLNSIIGSQQYSSQFHHWPLCKTVRSVTGTSINKILRRGITNKTEDDKDVNLKEKKLSLIQRFKQSYAIYGKVVIAVHGMGSCFWLGSFYLAASSGLSILELFEAANFPQWMCDPLRMGGGAVNTWTTALVLYKIASPLRYGLTLLLTRYVVRYLRTSGRAPQLPEQDRIRNLAKESAKLSSEHLQARLKRGRKKALSMSKKVRRKALSSKDLD